jgi:cell division protein FtsI (penicillin-binding protein 3)
MISMSYGYASRVSALHTLTLYNAVANGGKMMKPYLVQSIRQGGVVYKENIPTVLNSSIARPEVIDAARRSMEMVTSRGTAAGIFDELPFMVAGKTGTSRVWDKPYVYNDKVYQASFVGYFPADRPQYTCIVLIRTKPHAPVVYGGKLAGPVFREIATKIHALYVDSPSANSYVRSRKDSSLSIYAGSRRSLERVYSALKISRIDSSKTGEVVQVRSEKSQNRWSAKTSNRSAMPDLRGMGLRDAVLQIERLQLGIQIEVKGKGKIASQSIEPGISLTRGLKLQLDLN